MSATRILTLQETTKKQPLMAVSSHFIILNDERETFVFNRQEALKTLNISQTRCLTERRMRARLKVSLCFEATLLRDDTLFSVCIERFFTRSKQARAYRDSLLRRVVHADDQLPNVSTWEKRKNISITLASSLAGVCMALGIGVAALGIHTVLDVANAVGQSQVQNAASNVKAWSTPSIPAYGYLEAHQFAALKELGKSAGITVPLPQHNADNGYRNFYVFTGLDCEQCRDLDAALLEVDPYFVPVILPSNVMRSDLALLGAAQAYCAQDPALKWYELQSGVNADGSVSCDTWKEKITQIELAKSMVDLGSITMGVVAPNGAVYDGSLSELPKAQRAAALTEWLQANKN